MEMNIALKVKASTILFIMTQIYKALKMFLLRVSGSLIKMSWIAFPFLFSYLALTMKYF